MATTTSRARRRQAGASGNGRAARDPAGATAPAPAPQAGDEDLPEPQHVAEPLDALLTDAAFGPLRRWLPGRAGIKTAAKLALRPDTVATRSVQLATELGKVAVGRSDVEPDKRDRRFKDPA